MPAESNTSVAEEEGTAEEQLNPEEVNIAMYCTLNFDNIERFVRCFEDEDDPFYEAVKEQVNIRGDGVVGKTALEMAAILGRVGMTKELSTRGSDVNASTTKGYTALHHAAAWGKIDCLKVLVDSGADLHAQTKYNERARDMALRYFQSECVDYLDWAEAKQNLIDAVRLLRETVADPEKATGRLTRDDKNTSNALCTEKEQWVISANDATTKDFITVKEDFDAAAAAIWQKLNEPLPEKHEKK